MFQRGLAPPDPFRERDILEECSTQDGMSLKAMAELGRLLVVLLPALERAQRWLAALQESRSGIEGAGVRLALVHMADDVDAAAALARYDLQYLARVSDPERQLYRHFELVEQRPLIGAARQLPGLVWLESGQVTGVSRPTRVDRPPVLGPDGPNATNRG